MNKLKNIIIVNDFNYTQGGASKVAIDTANLLALNTDYKVYFFSGDTKEENSLDKKIIQISTNQGECLKNKNKLKGALNGIYNFKAKKGLKKLLKTLNQNETIIHVHGWTKCLSSSIFDVAFKMKFKVVLTMHDYFTSCPNGGYFNYVQNEICHLKPLSLKCIKCNCDSRNYGFKIYRVVRQFVQNKIVKLNDNLSDVISISDFSENVLKKSLTSSTQIHRVYNPIDLDKKQVYIDPSKNNYYLYVGRVSKEKGVDIFCKAISSLKLKGIVVGDGNELKKLKKEYPDIEYVGWKNNDEVKEYMKCAKALIFPSRWYEGSPLTPLEAMQYGIPCLNSNVSAAIEYNIDDKISFSPNSKSLIECINYTEKHIKTLSKKSYEFVNKKRKYDYFESLSKVYNEVGSNERK